MKALATNTRLPITFRLAIRDLRGGLKGFRVFLACLILGVAAIAGVGSLTRSITDGLAREGQSILGGDIEIRTFQLPANADQIAHFESLGTVSRNIRMRAMTRATESAGRTMTEIKAVDTLYPLYGDLILTPQPTDGVRLGQIDGRWGAAIPPELAQKIRADLGDEVLIGNGVFEVRAIMEKEPDRSNEGIQWGPTVLISIDAMPDTGLTETTTFNYYHYRIRLPEGANVDGLRDELADTYEQERWRIRDRFGSAPGLRRFIESMGMFLTLVGLTALVVGGVGVGNAVRSYLNSKHDTIGTLKVLGATGDIIFRVYLIQIMAMALVAVTVGLLLGAAVPAMLGTLLPTEIPVSPTAGLFTEPLITAAVYGVLITLAFAIWPLAKARDVSAAQLFRAIVAPSRRFPKARYTLAVIAASIAILALAIGLSDLKAMAAGFAIGAGISLILLRLTGYAIERGAARLPRPKKTGLRLAIANLHRPGSATGAVVLSLGLGLTLFAMVALVESNLGDQVREQLPDRAPDFVLLDIQTSQVDEFVAMASSLEGLEDLRIEPIIRGRITHVAGIPSDEIEDTGEAGWVLRGSRGLTFSGALPENNTLVEGEWWAEDYSGPPLISFTAEEARDLGIKVGDVLTFNILGREIEATVASLREVVWETLGFNFVVVFAPGTLEKAAPPYMASIQIDPANEIDAHIQLTDAFPNVTTIRAREVVETLNNMLESIAAAIRATASVTIITGILVLAGAMAAGQKQRVYDAVVLKILGAVRSDVLKAYVTEYALLGMITGVIGFALGGLAGYVVIVYVMELEFTFFPVVMISTIGASIFFTVFFGLIGTWSALGAKPTEVLREN